jgi:hypothetical protein
LLLCTVDAKPSTLSGNQERQQEALKSEDNRILLIRKGASNWLEPRACGRLCT